VSDHANNVSSPHAGSRSHLSCYNKLGSGSELVLAR
jgi:hypothetical protein